MDSYFKNHNDPWTLFSAWWREVQESSSVREKQAMTLATADASARPLARTVLLKEFSPTEGFVFYTNYLSRKGRHLSENPQASLLFYWDPLFRQVIVRGDVSPLPRDRSLAYWRSRPRQSQIAGLLSKQSEEIAPGVSLVREWNRLEQEFLGREIPCPDHWGGYRVMPQDMEFWLGHTYRLHDRVRFTWMGSTWQKAAIYP